MVTLRRSEEVDRQRRTTSHSDKKADRQTDRQKYS